MTDKLWFYSVTTTIHNDILKYHISFLHIEDIRVQYDILAIKSSGDESLVWCHTFIEQFLKWNRPGVSIKLYNTTK